MKKLFVFIMFSISSFAFGQDVIVKKDGSTILSKVLEVNPSDIKYKKFSNQDGPTYTIIKSEIVSINYENGEKDVFNDSPETNVSQQKTPKGYIAPIPTSTNQAAINSYNITHSSLKPNKGKKSSGCFTILGMSPNSIIADENVEVIFKHYGYSDLDIENIFLDRRCQECDYEILISNKTNHIIYVDLGNTFRIYDDNRFETFYDGKQTTITSGGSAGVGLNMGSVASIAGIGGPIGLLAGGLTVGASSSSSHSTTYAKQRFISVPPRSTQSLGKCVWEHPNGKGNIKISSAEFIPDGYLGFDKNTVKAGEVITYNPEDSPYKRQYLITYSVEMDFSTYTTLNANLYMRYIIGIDKSYSHRTKSLEKDFVETIGNYNEKTLCGFYHY